MTKQITFSMKWIIFNVICLSLIAGGILMFEYNKSEGMRFVSNMGAGWNLGNTLDAHGKGIEKGDTSVYETYWGNPITAKENIADIKKAGFGTVRIPVTWYEHMDEGGEIDKEWLERVGEIVDMVLQEDMYAIVDLHHEDWLSPTYVNSEKAILLLNNVWSQISKYFKDYDQRLIFEGFNEVRLIGTDAEWNEGTVEAREIVNVYNQVFVETVRKAGGNNTDRYLMIAPYCHSAERQALEDFVFPDDQRLIVSIHEYVPYRFTMKVDGDLDWNENDLQDTEKIDEVMNNLSEIFTSKKKPVIISEFATADKNNTKARVAWAEYYVKAAKDKGIMCIWWDEGSRKGEKKRFQLYDRYERKWLYPEIVKVLVDNQ